MLLNDYIIVEKLDKHATILLSAPSEDEARLELTENHRGHHDHGRAGQQVQHAGMPCTKVGVRAGVEDKTIGRVQSQ